MQFPNIYAHKHYKLMLVIPIAMLVCIFLLLPSLKMGVDLRGGTQIIAHLDHAAGEPELMAHLAQYNLEDLSIKFTKNPIAGTEGIVIEFAGTPDLLEAEKLVESNPERAIALAKPFITSNVSELMTAREVVELAKSDFNGRIQAGFVSFLGISKEQISVVEVGASLGEEFWASSQRALLVALVLIAGIVFIMYRDIIPSIAVIQASAFDALTAVGGMALLGIPFSLPTIAALLMILGCSVDNNIMITDRILRRRDGTAAERAGGAVVTGFTMTSTLLIVLLIVIAVSSFNQMTSLFQIAAVLAMGLAGDLPATYITNAVMVLWLAERKK